MSTSIDQAFITAFDARLKHVFQREAAYLRDAVRFKTGVIGSTAVFQKLGKGVATTKARHGVINPMNAQHTAPSVTLQDFYAGDWIDKLDEAKINIDERDAVAKAGAMALGRKVDDQITTALDSTTQPAVTLTVTSAATVRATAVALAEAAWANDVPNDGEVFCATTPRYWSQLMQVQEFSRADWVGYDRVGQAWRGGPQIGSSRWKDWMGVKWKMQTGLPGAGTATASILLWHKAATGYAAARSAGNIAANDMVAADITWHGDRAAHFVNNLMSGNALLIDDTGAFKGTVDDTAPIVTS